MPSSDCMIHHCIMQDCHSNLTFTLIQWKLTALRTIQAKSKLDKSGCGLGYCFSQNPRNLWSWGFWDWLHSNSEKEAVFSHRLCFCIAIDAPEMMNIHWILQANRAYKYRWFEFGHLNYLVLALRARYPDCFLDIIVVWNIFEFSTPEFCSWRLETSRKIFR